MTLCREKFSGKWCEKHFFSLGKYADYLGKKRTRRLNWEMEKTLSTENFAVTKKTGCGEMTGKT